MTKNNSMPWKKIFLCTVLLLGIWIANQTVNQDFYIKALCRDDLGFWELTQQDFWSCIWNTDAHKLRPIAYGAIWCLYALLNGQLYLITYVLRGLSFLEAVVFFFLVRDMTKKELPAFCVGVCFVVSHYAYYDVTQVFGIMEGLAMTFSALMLHALFRYLNSAEKSGKHWWGWACLWYVMSWLTHERYMVMVPLFFIAFFLKHGKDSKKHLFELILPSVCFFINLVIRLSLFGSRWMDGTGDVAVQDSFSFPQLLTHLRQMLLGMLGINTGELYLIGRHWDDLPQTIQRAAWGGIALLALIILLLFTALYLRRSMAPQILKNLFLLLCFIGGIMVAGAITFRLEMRWIYTPYLGMLFSAAYGASALEDVWRVQLATKKQLGALAQILLAGYMLCCVPVEIAYRAGYGALYYWRDQVLANHVYEATVPAYGDGLWKKDAIVLLRSDATETQKINRFFPSLAPKTQTDVPDYYWTADLSQLPDSVDKNNAIILQLQPDLLVANATRQ